MICRLCGEEKPHNAHGMCKKCYDREGYIKRMASGAYKPHTIKCIDCHVVYKSATKNTLRCRSCHIKYKKQKIVCTSCGELKKHAAKQLCKSCYDKYYTKRKTCGILKKHHEDMKNDPEALTTEFIQEMVNVDCGETQKSGD